jgi:hypothetical protein
MARKGRLLKDIPLCAEILNGDHDDILDAITQACKHRVKSRYRKGMTVRLVGTKNATLEGKEARVLKVNTKTVSVGVGEVRYEEWDTRRACPYYEGGEYNVSPSLLEAVTAP